MGHKFYTDVELNGKTTVGDRTENGQDMHSVVLTKENLQNNKEIVRVKDLAELTAEYDTSKGSIEQRLTALGFKEGDIRVSQFGMVKDPNITQNKVFRQGNYVIGKLEVTFTTTSSVVAPLPIEMLFRVGDNFKPYNGGINGSLPLTFSGRVLWGNTIIGGATVTLNDIGLFTISIKIADDIRTSITCSLLLTFGYEAVPIDATTL